MNGSREAAQECSPRRKPWVQHGKSDPAPKGRKKPTYYDVRPLVLRPSMPILNAVQRPNRYSQM